MKFHKYLYIPILLLLSLIASAEETATIDGSMVFNDPVANAATVNTNRVYEVKVTHNLNGASDSIYINETEKVSFSYGLATVLDASDNQLRTETLQTFAEYEFTGFSVPLITGEGTPEDNVISVTANYKTSDFENVVLSNVFGDPNVDPADAGGPPPAADPDFPVVTTSTFNNYRIYNLEVTHNLTDAVDSFIIMEQESVTFSDGTAAVAGDNARNITLQSYPQYTLKGFTPPALTAIGTPEDNIISVDAVWNTSAQYNVTSTYVFPGAGEGLTSPDPEAGESEVFTSTDFSIDTFRIYNVEVNVKLTTLQNNFLVRETETVNFAKGRADIPGENPRHHLLHDPESLTHQGFSQNPLQAFGTPENNIFKIDALYKDSQTFGVDNVYTFDTPGTNGFPEDPEAPDPADSIAGTYGFNSYQLFKLNINFEAANITDSFIAEEATKADFSGNQLTLSENTTGVKTLSYTATGFTPNNFYVEQQADFNNEINIRTTVEDFTVTFFSNANGALVGDPFQIIGMGGSTTLVAAKPDPGYIFDQWSDGDTNPLKVVQNVTENKSFTASYLYKEWDVVFTHGPNGTLAGEQNQTVANNKGVGNGLDATPVTAVPDPGYKLDKWDDNSTELIRTLTNVTSDITRDAQFVLHIPELLSHKDGALLSFAENHFFWEKIHDNTSYTLKIGTTSGGDDIDSIVNTPSLEFKTAEIPSDGSTVYLTLEATTGSVTATKQYTFKTGLTPLDGSISTLYRGMAELAKAQGDRTLGEHIRDQIDTILQNPDVPQAQKDAVTGFRDHLLRNQPSHVLSSDHDISDPVITAGLVDSFIGPEDSVTIDPITYRQDDPYAVYSNPYVQTPIYEGYPMYIVQQADTYDIRQKSGTVILGNPTENDYLVYGPFTNWSASTPFSRTGASLQIGLDGVSTSYSGQYDATVFYQAESYEWYVDEYGAGLYIHHPEIYIYTSAPLSVNVYNDIPNYEINITSQPVGGTVAVDANLMLTYIPNAGFSGPDSFTYEFKNSFTGDVYKTINYKVMVTGASSDKIFDFASDKVLEDEFNVSVSGKKFKNRAGTDSLTVNGQGTLKYNGSGGAFAALEETDATGPSMTGPLVLFQNDTNRRFAIETAFRFPENNPSGIVILDSEYNNISQVKLELLEDGKIKLTCKNPKNQTLTATTSAPVDTSDWVQLSVLADLNASTVKMFVNDAEVTVSKSGSISEFALSSSKIDLFERFSATETTFPALDVDYIRVITNLESITDFPQTRRQYFSESNNDIILDGWNFLNKLSVPEGQYMAKRADGSLNSYRKSNYEDFYHFHPSIYSSYSGFNEFKFGLLKSLNVPDSTKVTIHYKKNGAADWKTLIDSDLSVYEEDGEVRWYSFPWNTNRVQNDWTQAEVDSKSELASYQYKITVNSAVLADRDIELTDYVNVEFKPAFSYAPQVTALQPDKAFSRLSLDLLNKDSSKVLRDIATVNPHDRIVDILVRKQVTAPAVSIESFDETKLFAAQEGETIDGVKILFRGNIFNSSFPQIFDAAENPGRYVYQTFTLFTDDTDALNSTDPNINMSIIRGGSFIYDSENNTDGLEFVDNNLQDSLAPYQPVIKANPGDSSVSLSWSYFDRDNGTSADIEVSRIKLEILEQGKVHQTVELGNVRSVKVIDLTNGTPYTFRLTSYDQFDNNVTAEITATPVRTAVAVADVSNLHTYVGTDTVALKWHYDGNPATVDPITFLKWKSDSSTLSEGTIGFLIFRRLHNAGAPGDETDELIAALPVDFDQPSKDYLFIDKGLQSGANYTYQVISIDRDNNRTSGISKLVKTHNDESLENAPFYSSTVFPDTDNDLAAWHGAEKGAKPDLHLGAALPSSSFDGTTNYLIVPAGPGKNQLFQRYIPENTVFSASVTAKITGPNLANSGISILKFKNLDNETDSRFPEIPSVVRELTLYEDYLTFNGSRYDFAHGGETHTYSVNRFNDEFQLIIDEHIIAKSGDLSSIAFEKGNSFIRFGTSSANLSVQAVFSNVTYLVGVPYYFSSQPQIIDVVPPAAPQNIVQNTSTANEITLSWDAPLDTDVRAHLLVLDNFVNPGTAGGSPANLPLGSTEWYSANNSALTSKFRAFTRTNSITLSLPDSIPFTARVIAIDEAGNYSAASQDISFTVASSSIGTAEVQDATTAWTGWNGNSQTFAPWVEFITGNIRDKDITSGSDWSLELKFALMPDEHILPDTTKVKVMKDNSVLKFTDNSDPAAPLERIFCFKADTLDVLTEQNSNSSVANSFSFVAGGAENALRIINKDDTQYVYLNSVFVGITTGFEFDNLAVGNISGAGLSVKSLKVVTGTTAAAEFDSLSNSAPNSSEPEVVINEASTVRNGADLKLNIASSANAATLNIKVIKPHFESWHKVETSDLFSVNAVPLTWISGGVQQTLGEISFPANAEPLPYIVSVKPLRSDAHQGLGDAHSYEYAHTAGAELANMRINTEDLTPTPWQSTFGAATSQTLSYPSFVIPFDTITTGEPEENAAEPTPDFYTASLQATNWEFSSWTLIDGFEGTIMQLVGVDASGDPQVIPVVYEDGRLWIYNSSIDTELYDGQINHIRIVATGSLLQVFLNKNPVYALQFDAGSNFTGATSNVKFGAISHNDTEINSQRIVWSVPELILDGSAVDFNDNGSVAAAWTNTGIQSHTISEHKYFGSTSIRAKGADDHSLFVNKSALTGSTLGSQWTAEFSGAATQGSSMAHFYTEGNKKISFALSSSSSVYRIIYDSGRYHIFRNGASWMSGETEDDPTANQTKAFEIAVTAPAPTQDVPEPIGAFLLKQFKVITGGTDSLTAGLNPLRGAFYAEEVARKPDTTVDTALGQMHFQPVYLSTAATGLNWNFDHNVTVPNFTAGSATPSHQAVSYAYEPGIYGVTIIEEGDFTVGLNYVTTTYQPSAGPHLNAPRNLTVSRTATTMTFTWNAPAGIAPNQYLIQLFDPENGLIDFDPASLDPAITASGSILNFDPATVPQTISVTYNIPASAQNKELQLYLYSQYLDGGVLTGRSEPLQQSVEPYDANSVAFDPSVRHLEAFPEDRAIRLQVSFPPADLQGYLLWRSDPGNANAPTQASVDKILVRLDDKAVSLIDQLKAGYPATSMPDENILGSLPANANYFFFHGDESSFDFKVNNVDNSTDDNPRDYHFSIDPYDDPSPSATATPNLGSAEVGTGTIVSDTDIANVNVVSTVGFARNQSPEIISSKALITVAGGNELQRLGDLTSQQPSWIVNNLDPDILLIPSANSNALLSLTGPVIADRSLSKVEVHANGEIISSIRRVHNGEDVENPGAGFYYNPNDRRIYHDFNTTFTASRYLRNGINNIYFTGTDDDAAESTGEARILGFDEDEATAQILLDTDAPTLSVVAPVTDAQGRHIHNELLNITGLYSDASGLSNIEVQVNGQIMIVDSSNAKAGNGVFSVDLAGQVVDGEHTVKVILTDLAGNTSEQEFNIIYTSTQMSAGVIHQVNVFDKREFYTVFDNVTLADISKITMNGVELDSTARQLFYNASEVAPVTLESIGYSNENDPGNHLVMFRIYVDLDVNGQTVTRELRAMAEWYVNDALPTVTSTFPSVNEFLFTDTAGDLILDSFIINVFDQEPGVEFDKIEVLDENGDKIDVKSLFDLTEFAAILKEGSTLQLYPEDDEGEFKKAVIYLTLKEKVTGVVVESKLNFFVLPETYEGPMATGISRWIVPTGKQVALKITGKNLNLADSVTFTNLNTGKKFTYFYSDVNTNASEDTIDVALLSEDDGVLQLSVGSGLQPQLPVLSLPFENDKQAKAAEDLIGDANNDGEINGFDYGDLDQDPEEKANEVKEYASLHPIGAFNEIFGIVSEYDSNPVGNEKIKIHKPQIQEEEDNTAILANGFINVEGNVPRNTYRVEITIRDQKEIAALSRNADGTVQFYGKNIYLDDLSDTPENVTVKAYINDDSPTTQTYSFKVKTGKAPEILGFLAKDVRINAYKSLYKSLRVGNKLAKKGYSTNGDEPTGLDGLITSEYPINLETLNITVDGTQIPSKYWYIKKSEDLKNIQLIFRDFNKINIFDINSSTIKNYLIGPWQLFEGGHNMTVSVSDIYGNSATVKRPFILNRGEKVLYKLAFYENKVTAQDPTDLPYENAVESEYKSYAQQIHTYIRQGGNNNLGLNRMFLTNLRLEPEVYSFTLDDLKPHGIYFNKYIGRYIGSDNDVQMADAEIRKDLQSKQNVQGEYTPEDFYKLYYGTSPFPGNSDPVFEKAIINSTSGEVPAMINLDLLGEPAREGGAIEQLSIRTQQGPKWRIEIEQNMAYLQSKTIQYKLPHPTDNTLQELWEVDINPSIEDDGFASMEFEDMYDPRFDDFKTQTDRFLGSSVGRYSISLSAARKVDDVSITVVDTNNQNQNSGNGPGGNGTGGGTQSSNTNNTGNTTGTGGQPKRLQKTAELSPKSSQIIIGKNKPFSLTVTGNENDHPPEVELGGNTTVADLLEITNAEDSEADVPSETEDGTIDVKVNFPAIEGSIAHDYIVKDENGYYYDMRHNNRYKVYGNGFVVSSSDDRLMLHTENAQTQYMPVSKPYAYIDIDKTAWNISYDQEKGQHKLDVEFLIFDPLLAYDIFSDPSGITDVSVNDRKIYSGSTDGSIVMNINSKGLPTYRVKVKDLLIRRGLNGIHVSTVNKLKVRTDSYFSIEINDTDDLLKTDNDLYVNSVQAIPRTSNSSNPVLHYGHIFGEYKEGDSKITISTPGGNSSEFILPQHDSRFGRFHRQFFLFDQLIADRHKTDDDLLKKVNSPFVITAPGEYAEVSSHDQKLNVYAEGLQLLDTDNSSLDTVNLDKAFNDASGSYALNLTAYLAPDKANANETPRFAVQVFSEYGYSLKLTPDSNTVYIDSQLHTNDWGDDANYGWKEVVPFKFSYTSSNNIYEPSTGNFHLQPGQIVKIGIKGVSRLFKVKGYATSQKYELVTGLTPTVDFDVPATSQAVIGEVITNTGQMKITHGLHTVQGRKLSTYFGLTYRSSNEGSSPQIGSGWTASWDRYFELKNDGLLFNSGDGRKDFFKVTGNSLEVPAGYNLKGDISEDRTTVTLSSLDGTVTVFRKVGLQDVWKIISVTDRYQNQIIYYYNTVGNLISIKDDLGRFYNFFYGNTPNGLKLTSFKDFEDFAFSFEYDPQTGNLLSVNLAGAPDKVEYFYNENNLVSKINDYLHIEYNSTNQVTEVIRGDENNANEQLKDTFSYSSSQGDKNQFIYYIDTDHVDPNNIPTEFTFRFQGSKPTGHTRKVGSATNNFSKTVDYNSGNLLASKQGVESIIEEIDYVDQPTEASSDRRGDHRIENIINTTGYIDEFKYHTDDKWGRLESHKSPTGVTTAYSYSEKEKNGRVLETNVETAPDQDNGKFIVTTVKLNKYGQPEEEEGPFYKKTYSYYISDDHFKNKDDREGYLYSVRTQNFSSRVEAGSVVTGNAEDTITDNQQDVTEYTGRDAYGRLISSTNIKGATTLYTYNSIGQLLRILSPPIVIGNENNLNIDNPEDTRVETINEYDSHGVVTKVIKHNPRPVYKLGKISYEPLTTEMFYNYDKAYRLISTTIPYKGDVYGTVLENKIVNYYDNDGKGSRVKATQQPNGAYEVTLIDDAGRIEYKIDYSDTHSLTDSSVIPEGAIVTRYTYNSDEQLENTYLIYSGNGATVSGGAQELREERKYYESTDHLLKTHTTFFPYRKKTYSYINGELIDFEKIEDSSNNLLQDVNYDYHPHNMSLKEEHDRTVGVTKKHTYDFYNRRAEVTFIGKDDKEKSKTTTWTGGQGQELAAITKFTHPSNEEQEIVEQKVSLYDVQNNPLTSRTYYRTQSTNTQATAYASVHSIQEEMKKNDNYFKTHYSSTDHEIGSELPKNLAKNNQIKLYPSSFGVGLKIDQEGKVHVMEYNEIGQPIQIIENAAGQERPPRVTNYSYINKGYNYNGVTGARAVMISRTEANIGRTMAREEVYTLQEKLRAAIDYDLMMSVKDRMAPHIEKVLYEYDNRLRTKVVTKKDGSSYEYLYYGPSNSDNSLRLEKIVDASDNSIVFRHQKNYNIFGFPEELDEFNYHDTNGDDHNDTVTRVRLERKYSTADTTYGKFIEEKTTVSRRPSFQSTYTDIFNKTVKNEYYDNGPRKKLIYPDNDIRYYIYKGNMISEILSGEPGDDLNDLDHDISTVYEDSGVVDLRTPTRMIFRKGGNTAYQRFHYKNNDRRYGLVEKITLTNGSTTRTLASYTHDDLLRKSSKNQWSDVDNTFKYDKYNRLRESTSTDSLFTKSDHYTLDQFDSFKQNSDNKINGSIIRVNQGNHNRYTSFDSDNNLRAASPAPLNSYSNATNQQTVSYDANGNMTSDGNYNYTWDYFNRLRSAENLHYVVAELPNKAHHVYDSVGRRVNTFYRNADGTQTLNTDWEDVYYTYDSTRLLEIGHNSNSYEKRYSYDNGHSPYKVELDLAIDETYWFARDELGNIAGVFKSHLTEKYYYSASGLMTVFERQTLTGEYVNEGKTRSEYHDFGWGGMFIDPYTGHYKTHLRMYDPVMNRWLSEDPSGMADGFNLYSNYFNVNRVDPNGDSILGVMLVAGLLTLGDAYFHNPNDDRFNLSFSIIKNTAIAASGAWAGNLVNCGSKGLAWGIETVVDAGASTAYDVAVRGESFGSALTRNTIMASIGSGIGRLFGKKCFVAGTQVKTKGGFKNIEDIKVGDFVWSKSDVTGQADWKPVVRTFVNKKDTLVHLKYRKKERKTHSSQRTVPTSDDEDGSRSQKQKTSTENEDDEDPESQTLTGTPEHPFWSVDRQNWITMGSLEEGETLLLSDGSKAVIVSLEVEQAIEGESFTTYNFEVADWNTYFVRPENSKENEFVWVHNSCQLDELKAIADDVVEAKYVFKEYSDEPIDFYRVDYEGYSFERMRVSAEGTHGMVATNFRQKTGAHGAGNIGVFDVTVDGRLYHVVMKSNGSKKHSEARFINEIIKKKIIKKSQVKSIYTEWGPCLDGGGNIGGCSLLIHMELPGVPVYFSWRYLKDKGYGAVNHKQYKYNLRIKNSRWARIEPFKERKLKVLHLKKYNIRNGLK